MVEQEEEMTDLLGRFVAWDHRLGIRRTIVLFVTLWMTWRAFGWAAEYAVFMKGVGGLEVAAIIAAVTAPISYLQKAVFDAYLKAKNNASDAS